MDFLLVYLYDTIKCIFYAYHGIKIKRSKEVMKYKELNNLYAEIKKIKIDKIYSIQLMSKYKSECIQLNNHIFVFLFPINTLKL